MSQQIRPLATKGQGKELSHILVKQALSFLHENKITAWRISGGTATIPGCPDIIGYTKEGISIFCNAVGKMNINQILNEFLPLTEAEREPVAKGIFRIINLLTRRWVFMPFESKAQMRYMFAKHPKIAREFAGKTPNIRALPEHVKSGRGRAGSKIKRYT